mmetsp:Transcript_86914/g.254371  ORF Transcript_86914/g.254371 Transcript_86914/m.254371 type:complete len:357 (+) Transcript_86914:111-1181(+)
MAPVSTIPSTVANGRFEITQKLGSGCFGVVYKGIDTQTKLEVAVKFENIKSSAPQLEHEASILSQLSKPGRTQGLVNFFWFGKEADMFCLVMEVLGLSLGDRLKTCGGHLSLTTLVLVADQALRRIEYLHSKCIIHRDIKPENFLFGVRERQHHLYLIDLGLSRRYFEHRRHVPLRQTPSLTGTARYASINAHRGVEQSRRDDLEAIGHMLVYLARGSVPWSGLEARTRREKYRRIMEAKEATRLADLCKGLPEEFEAYLAYCRRLLFMERPKYRMLRELFLAVRERLGGERGRPIEDHEFQWLNGKDTTWDLKGKGLLRLLPHRDLAQPDDPRDYWARACWRRLCSCGGSVSVRE